MFKRFKGAVLYKIFIPKDIIFIHFLFENDVKLMKLGKNL